MENKKKKLFYRSVGDADNNRWLFSAGLDEMRSTGCYTVQLWHGNDVGELPLPACDDEHYIVATLIVTESGTADKLQKNRAIGQTLILSQCNDGQTGIYYRSLAPVNGNFVWSEWNALLSTGQFNEIAQGSTSITLEVKDNSITAQKLATDVREKVENPLLPLFIAVGAEYNATGADIIKIAPWGETVTHKAGHYYLNGLGDITEAQMIEIYKEKDFIYRLNHSRVGQGLFFRTILPFSGSTISQRSNVAKLVSMVFYGNKELEVLKWGSSLIDEAGGNSLSSSTSVYATFYSCSNLRIVYPINVETVTEFYDAFKGCTALYEVRLDRLKKDVQFSESPLLSKKSILYIINNAIPASAITITLHPGAYARLADDADIVTALEAKPLVSLVSA